MDARTDRAGQASEPLNVDKRSGWFGRAGSVLLWYGVPALALMAVVAYVLGATIGHVNPPAVPVEGVSMRPTLQAGDLIVLKGVDPRTLRKGDIVAVNVPKSARDQYGLPGQVVHRIVRIGHDAAGGEFFVTKGDANSGADVFQTHPGDVVGKLAFHIPAAGYPFLFFRSRQGEIFLAVGGLVALAYFVLGLFEERRVYVAGTARTMQTVLEETRELKEAIGSAKRLAAPPSFDRLADEVRVSSTRSEENRQTVRELVAAISDYGQHLRSHTEVMKNLAATTTELTRATSEMRSAVEQGVMTRAFVPSRELLERAPLRMPTAELTRGAELDRVLEETAARIEEASRRREELRRVLGAARRP